MHVPGVILHDSSADSAGLDWLVCTDLRSVDNVSVTLTSSNFCHLRLSKMRAIYFPDQTSQY